jgi:uncharacterized protein YeaO (DUF488 family)
MVLYTGCIYSIPKSKDGVRISVMSRHTLNDGVTRDPKITSDLYQEHLDLFAPPLKLIGSYKRKEIIWEKFEQEYRYFLGKKQVELLRLGVRAQMQDLTLLCVEATPEQCHRRLLAEEMKKLLPSLEVLIR